MMNPWLTIPADDYEGHMESPEVMQAQALSALFASALAEHAPESVAVIGCATGNGFEHLSGSQTGRVVGVDINPDYLDILKSRFMDRIQGLELVLADCSATGFGFDPVSLIFAGLLFEYVKVDRALGNIAGCLAPGGVFVAVLQLPSTKAAPEITATGIASIERLAPIMSLVSPDDFDAACRRVGLEWMRSEAIPLKQGKSFHVGHYRKPTASAYA